MKTIRLLFVTSLQPVIIALLAQTAATEGYVIREVMSGLVSPRGMAFGPDGGLYVAEAGRGGSGPGIMMGNGKPAFYGASGGVSRLLNGRQERVLDGLPSLANSSGQDVRGLNDILFDDSGQAFGLFGLGANSRLRHTLGPAGPDFATLMQLPMASAGSFARVADIAGHDLTSNPDGVSNYSNPVGIALAPGGGFLVADAGVNTFLNVTSAGEVATLGVLPTLANPSPVGPTRFQSMPTSITVGPDGAYYIGQITALPASFPVRTLDPNPNVYRFDPATNQLTVAYSGYTNIVDLTFGGDGNLYVLHVSSNSLASAAGPGDGALIKIDPRTGSRSVIASAGLSRPTSVLAGGDGTLYVTNGGSLATGGQVLSITPVPEPTSLLLVFCAAGACSFRRVPRRRRPGACRASGRFDD